MLLPACPRAARSVLYSTEERLDVGDGDQEW